MSHSIVFFTDSLHSHRFAHISNLHNRQYLSLPQFHLAFSSVLSLLHTKALRGLPFSTYTPKVDGWGQSSLLYISMAYYMQKVVGSVQIACKIAYVLNVRPLSPFAMPVLPTTPLLPLDSPAAVSQTVILPTTSHPSSPAPHLGVPWIT